MLVLARAVASKCWNLRPKDLCAAEAVNEAYVIAAKNKARWDAGHVAAGPGVTERAWMWVRTMGDLKDRFDALRRQSRQFATLGFADGVQDDKPGGGDPALAAAQRADLREALATLPAKQRRVVSMVYFDGMSQVEVAEKLKISQPAVSQMLDRAFAKLRDVLGADDE